MKRIGRFIVSVKNSIRQTLSVIHKILSATASKLIQKHR